MKRDLIWGCISAFFAVLMVFGIIIDIIIGNWVGLIICVVALVMNTLNAVSFFFNYRRDKIYRKWKESHNLN